MSALVGVIMGSKSDWSTLSHTVEMLDKLGIPNEVKVVSAHRTPDLLFQYAEQAEARGIQVIIAGAGGAAGAAADAGPGTDFNAVERGCVSITPLQIDLTHTGQLASVAQWMK